MANLDYMRRKRFINALISDCKLQYREEEGATPHMKGNTVVMPPPAPDFSDVQNRSWMENLITTAYHATPDNRADLDFVPEGDDLGTIHNMVCKFNATNKRAGILYGADEYVRDAHTQLLASQDQEQMSPNAEALLGFDALARSEAGIADNGTADAFLNNMSDEGKAYLEKLASLLPDYLAERDGGKVNFDLANKIAEILNVEQEQPPSGSSGEGGEGDEGGGQQGEKGESEGEGRGEGQGEGEQESDGEGKGKEIKPLKTTGEGYKPSQIGENKDFNPMDYVSDNAFEPLKTKVVIPNGQRGGEARASQINNAMTTTLSTKVRNLLKVWSQARYQGGKKRGKINKRAIASIRTGNDRVFRQKEVRDTLDTAVMVLMDSSGSMSGSRYTHACAASVMLADCLQKLHIPSAVWGFTTNWNDGQTNIMYKHKGFNDNPTTEALITNMTSTNIRLQGNSDGEAVLYAHDQLMRQKAKRKIMIVLSDGQPADGSNPTRFLQHVTKEIQDSKGCELYGIGIQNESVKHFYKDYRILTRPDQLEATLLDLIKSSMM